MRSKRCATPWKVPIHSDSPGMPSSRSTRERISPAALLVKVTASRPCGETPSAWMSQAMRCVNTRVLPLPAPASTSTGPSGAVTAARCASFRGFRMGDKSMGGAFYTLKTCAYGKGQALWPSQAALSMILRGARQGVRRHALLRKAHQRHDEAEQHRADEESEDAPGCGPADRADEEREGRDMGVTRGEDRTEQILGNPQHRDPANEKDGGAPASLECQVQHRGDQHDGGAGWQESGERRDHPPHDRS